MLYNTTCITSYSELLPFSLSNRYCKALGKQLVQIESYDKLQALKSAMPDNNLSELWIGLQSLSHNITTKSDFNWLIPSPTSSNFTNWEKITTDSPKHPQFGRCAAINPETLLWNNRRCTFFYPFLCEQGGFDIIYCSLYLCF